MGVSVHRLVSLLHVRSGYAKGPPGGGGREGVYGAGLTLHYQHSGAGLQALQLTSC